MASLHNAQIKVINILVRTIVLLLVVINLIGNSDATKPNISYGVVEGDEDHECNQKHSTSCTGKPKNTYERGCIHEEQCRSREEEEEISVRGQDKKSTESQPSHEVHHDVYNRKVLKNSTPKSHDGDGGDDYGRDKKSFKPTPWPKPHRKH
ncbi:hypothetical protein PanWU01x14_088080 [Parasponia andersonii]|uniref:Rapid ALkalinization Factor n=1 Tax=Parasponia andersonii TaxID=3476 RepID=A0A2P5D7T8_PARAD|nr:hypothetical protein PanWU01x14_088080 [Parasponia andersonii]